MDKILIRNIKDIPFGARVLTLATAVRWIGWGFAETLIPILLYSFGNTYAEAGLLRSAYDVAMILSLPILGMIADKVRATTLILIGLFIYLFIGTSYFLSGVTGLVIFIIIARLLNGVSYAMDSLGRETYIRHHTPPGKLAIVFGYFDTVANFWWIAAAVVGIFLVKYIPIHALLFLITPTALISFIIVWRFRKKGEEDPVVKIRDEHKNNSSIKDIADWNWKLRGLAMFNFFIAFAGTVVMFFLPIEIYTNGANLSLVIIMGIISAIPALFGWTLGKLFDTRGTKIFGYGLLVFAMLLLSLAFLDGYVWMLFVSFAVGIVIELLSVGSNELMTINTNPEHFGRVGGLMKSIANIGALAGPLAVGIAIDSFGIHKAFLWLGLLMFALFVAFQVLKKNHIRLEKAYL